MYRMALSVALLSILVLASCLGRYAGRTDLSSENVMVNRIAYVDSLGIVYTVSGDGTGRQKMSGSSYVGTGSSGSVMAQSLNFETFHSWPTWSPDGSKLAVSRIDMSDDQGPSISIVIIDVISGRSRNIDEVNIVGMVAENSPHYLYWAPDSKHLSFLASTRVGLSLFIVDTDNGDVDAIDTGAPLYYSWGGEGLSMIVHIGPVIKLFENLDLGISGKELSRAAGFRAPAFSKDGSKMAYLSETDQDVSLQIVISDDLKEVSVGDLGRSSAFMWSPSSNRIAVADQDDVRNSAFNRLRIFSADGSLENILVEEPFIAYFWSPDGRRIAWVGIDSENQGFQWNVKDVNGSSSKSIFQFQPSRDQLTALSFFDQYAYSNSPWSPDSTKLVVSGTKTIPFEQRNGHTPEGARIYVLDVEGINDPLDIAEGSLATWSWN